MTLPLLSPEDEAALARSDFGYFVSRVFQTLNPTLALDWDPYLDVLCSALQDLATGKRRRQIVAMPPRHLKSECGSVALAAWFLGHNPDRHVMVVAYGAELSRDLAVKTRVVMQSDWYQQAFETRLKPRSSVDHLRTTAGGSRRATSIDGVATGMGADLLIFDDPQKAGDVSSEALRQRSNRAFTDTFLSRLNSPKSRILVIQQRFHEDDFIGHLLTLQADWNLLTLAAVAEEDETHAFTDALGRSQVWRRRQGEVLNPSRMTHADLDRIRQEIGERAWAAQYGQRPAPAGGDIVRLAWFGRYEVLPPSFDRVIQSWDTASKVTGTSDYSVCVTLGVLDRVFYVLDVYRARLIYPDLKGKVLELADIHRASQVLIEDAGTGSSLIQELQNAGFGNIWPMKTGGIPKAERMEGQTGVIRAGRVLLPEKAHWLADFERELELFPNGRHDDQVDALSQGLGHLTARFAGQGVYDFYRLAAESLRREEEDRIALVGPSGLVLTQSGEAVRADEHGIFWFKGPDARNMMRSHGWRQLTATELSSRRDSPS